MKRLSVKSPSLPPSTSASKPHAPLELEASSGRGDNTAGAHPAHTLSGPEVVALRARLACEGNIPALRDSLIRYCHVDVVMNMAWGIDKAGLDHLMAAWPESPQPSPKLTLLGGQYLHIDPELLARLLSNPHLTRLELNQVGLDPRVLQAASDAVAKNGTGLHTFTFRHCVAQMFDPCLAQLLSLLPKVQALHLQLIPSSTDQMPRLEECGELMATLLNKPLENLCLDSFGAALWYMVPHWTYSRHHPQWQSVTLENHRVTLKGANQLAQGALNGFRAFVHHIICRSAAETLALKKLGSDPAMDLKQACIAEFRKGLASALILRAHQTNARPLGVSIELLDLGGLHMLLPAIAHPAAKGVNALSLKWSPGEVPANLEPADPQERAVTNQAPMQPNARNFVRLVAHHGKHLHQLDKLDIHLDLPGTAADPGVRNSVGALSQVLRDLHLTTLDLKGSWFKQVPDALQNCIQTVNARRMHMHLQEAALGGCIRLCGEGHALPGRAGDKVLAHHGHPARLLTVLPALNSQHLKAFVDFYEATRARFTEDGVPGLPSTHPLKAVSDNVQARLKGGS